MENALHLRMFERAFQLNALASKKARLRKLCSWHPDPIKRAT